MISFMIEKHILNKKRYNDSVDDDLERLHLDSIEKEGGGSDEREKLPRDWMREYRASKKMMQCSLGFFFTSSFL